MKQERKSKLIIAIFVLALTIPSISYPFLKQFIDTANYENRELASKPELDYSNYLEFPNLYENYFNDHTAYKNQFIKLNNLINIKLFNTLDNSQVILGKDNWLFYKGEGGIAINEYKAENLYSKGQLEQILYNVVEYRNKIKETTGSDFILMLIPDKEHVYEELLPDYIHSKSDIKRIDQIYDYITQNSDVKVCYPLNVLRNAKKGNQVYYKYDTHWNQLGAYYGSMDLLKTIGVTKNRNLEFDMISDVSGDLAGMIYLREYFFDDSDYLLKNYFNNINVNEIFNDSQGNLSLTKYKSSVNNNKKIYFVGDSFREAMKKYLSKQFKDCTFVHRDVFNKNDYLDEHPDVFVYEMVERYNLNLLDLKY